MARLAELDAHFVHSTSVGWCQVEDMDQADGVIFDCPACAGDHPILVYFSNAPQGLVGDPGDGKRWASSGTGLADLTLSPSIALLSGCRWHGLVTAGEVTTL